MNDRDLFIEAKKALKYSYSPYSNYPVGAAVLTKTGKVYRGTNIENASYGVTICAERVAISKAVSEGDKDIESIAVASENGSAPPCGTCRQFIFEFGNDIRIILGESEEELRVNTIEELLPKGFRLEDK